MKKDSFGSFGSFDSTSSSYLDLKEIDFQEENFENKESFFTHENEETQKHIFTHEIKHGSHVLIKKLAPYVKKNLLDEIIGELINEKLNDVSAFNLQVLIEEVYEIDKMMIEKEFVRINLGDKDRYLYEIESIMQRQKEEYEEMNKDLEEVVMNKNVKELESLLSSNEMHFTQEKKDELFNNLVISYLLKNGKIDTERTIPYPYGEIIIKQGQNLKTNYRMKKKDKEDLLLIEKFLEYGNITPVYIYDTYTLSSKNKINKKLTNILKGAYDSVVIKRDSSEKKKSSRRKNF